MACDEGMRFASAGFCRPETSPPAVISVSGLHPACPKKIFGSLSPGSGSRWSDATRTVSARKSCRAKYCHWRARTVPEAVPRRGKSRAPSSFLGVKRGFLARRSRRSSAPCRSRAFALPPQRMSSSTWKSHIPTRWLSPVLARMPHAPVARIAHQWPVKMVEPFSPATIADALLPQCLPSDDASQL